MTTQSNPANISIKVSFKRASIKLDFHCCKHRRTVIIFTFSLIRERIKIIYEGISLVFHTVFLLDKEEFYGIDNVSHLSETCCFSFNLADLNYVETYQVIEDGSALTFPTINGVPFHVVGILGTPFMIKHNTIIDFATSEVIFNTPKVAKEP